MIYKNSIKILFSNFNLVWKSMIYHVLVFCASCFFMYLCVSPIYLLLENSGFITDIIDVYTNFISSLNLTDLFAEVNILNERFIEILVTNIENIWLNFLGMAIILFFFNVFMSNLSIMASANSLHYYMGSMNKNGFFSSFADTLSKNIRVQLIYFIVSLPIKILILGAMFLALKLFSVSFGLSLFAIFVIIVGFVLLTAFKYTLFATWIPTMIVLNFGIFKSLKTSIKTTFRKFNRFYSGAIGIVFTISVVNVVVGLFTFGVGLLITVPASYVLYSVFGMVSVYEGQGMRYYVDVYNVITPQKKEVSDKLKDMKFVV